MFELHCTSRAADAPFTPRGPAVEYIHVPKAGGTSVQHMLQAMASQNNVSHHQRDFEYSLASENTLDRGAIYDGQEPLGWGHAPTPGAFTAVSWRRDHLSLILSLYNYKVRSRQPMGLILQERESELRKSGIMDAHMFDALLRRNDPGAMGIANASSSLFLVPTSCYHTSHDPRALGDFRDHRTGAAKMQEALHAVMLQNLVAIDVVAVTEDLDNQLLSQLRWHAPLARLAPIGHENANTNAKTGALSRPVQVLSSAVRSILAQHPTFQREEWLCDFAARVAYSRSAHAASCIKHHVRLCPASCRINVSDKELQLLTRRFPANVSRLCLQKPPSEREWS